MNPQDDYKGVVARFARANERRVPASEPQMPLILEPAGTPSAKWLWAFLKEHSSPILDDISKYGAVLLRGFDIPTIGDFERTVLSIRGLRGINEVFMSEFGRTIVEGTSFVYHTNTLYKTGGTMLPPLFHNENCYLPDIPRYIAFFCIRPSWLGGETGLMNMVGLLSDMRVDLKSKVMNQSFAMAKYRLARVAERYQRSLEEVREFCARFDLPIVSRDGCDHVAIHKPCVIEHPTTHERALLIHFHELNRCGLSQPAQEAFADDYRGPQWVIHRLCWRFPTVKSWALVIGLLLVKPRRSVLELRAKFAAFRERFGGVMDGARSDDGPRLRSVFEPADVKALAASMRRHFSSVTWKPGDVLIIDNLKVAHSGMPGLGPRDLKVVMCNCVPIPCTPDSPGQYAPAPEDIRESLGAILRDGPPWDRKGAATD
jgi:hypothetical protein